MLRLQDVTVTLGAFRLGGIDLHVRKGEYLVIIGSTGTGKTVLLETIAGLHRVDRGRILLRGQDVTRLAPEKRNLGIVYQDYALFPHMTVMDNIAFGPVLQRWDSRKIREDVMVMADFLDLGHVLHRTPANLSGGERQRTALARALVMKPYMLLLDEPLSALDRLTRDMLKYELKRIHRNLGLTVLHITHDLSEAFLLADTLAVMRHGQIVQEGGPEQVLARPADRFVAELLGIRSFIPAEVDSMGMVHVPGLCTVPASMFSPAPDRSCPRILITVPDWAVELSMERGRGPWLFEGEARVVAVDQSGGETVVQLRLPCGTDIRASFSRRETARLAALPGRGEVVPCGVAADEVHWVPA